MPRSRRDFDSGSQLPSSGSETPQADGDDREDGRAPSANADPDSTETARDGDPASSGAPARKPNAETSADFERRLADQQDKYLRLAAEYDNFRRRTAKERIEAEGRGQAELVKLLIDPLDDLARFAHVDPRAADPSAIVKGAEMVEKKLQKVLAALGLEVVDPLDQTFNPALHEAVSTVPALSAEDDHVVAQVFQPGYLFNGQLLRPARVVVKQWNG
jgi:molecular chaperone GrpE